MDEPDHDAMTILYVDDEELARKYFVRAVKAEFRVLTAPSVDAALVMLKSGHAGIDVLVTDYRMPGQVGSELLRQARLHYPHIVRILVTAYADRNLLLDAANTGEIFRILEKPLDTEDIRSTLHLASACVRERNVRSENLRAIEEALVFLAHELNTPLATISNFARGIRRRLDSKHAPGLQTTIGDTAVLINDNVQYCLSLLARFVDTVKQVGSASVIRPPQTNSTARQQISSLLDTCPMTPEQRAMIETEVVQDFPITVSPNCVALVLSSVLNNALRALMQQSDPMLRFTVLVDPNPQIRITDNGPGIPPAVLEQLLFNPITMHAETGGSGWGMIFCNRIMRSFGGNIQVQSKPRQYTTITLNFPVIKKGIADDRHQLLRAADSIR